VADDAIGYILTQYPGRGLPPERSDFEDKIKAEKAFTDAKMVSILWQSRPVSAGLGWIKLKEKDAPPPSAVAPAAAKPAVPGAPVAPKPAVPAGATPAASPKPTAPANPVASAPPPAAAAPVPSVPPAAKPEASAPPKKD
jgi:hypothetical protein